MTVLKTAAAYIRVSDDRQDEYSPDSQLKKTREFAEKQGYDIPDEYVFYDDGISAKSVKRRTEFNRMIATAKDKDCPFDTIYVWKFSRFARNQEEALVYKNLLKKKGVSVVSVSEPIPEGAWGTLIERIIEWMDEYYLINLSGEVQRGMAEKASRGEAMSRQFGYDIVGKTYVPNADADIVREVFASFVSGEGERAIATRLTARGVRTSRGNPLDNRWVDYMLRNPVYIGKIRWSLDGHAASKRDYDNPNIQIYDGNHPPLIDMDTWDAAQQRIAANKKAYGKYQRKDSAVEWMLKGLLRCDSCGATLVHIGTPCPSMQCHNYSRGVCHVSHCLSIAKANKAVISYLEQAVELEAFDVVQREKPETDAPDFDKLLAAERQRLERAKSAYLDGIDTKEEYAANKAKYQKAVTQIEKERQEAQKSSGIDIAALRDRVLSVLDVIRSDTASEIAKSRAIRSVVDHIVYEKPSGNLRIYFYI